jgi:putative oxygen-independent coproporphyrinogen III oxidase
LSDPAPSEPANLGVYIHWPYCARICPYCDFAVVRDRGRKAEQAALVDAIAADLTAQAGILGERRLASIFLGGGTPSLMDPAAAGRLIALCRTLWPGRDGDGNGIEITLEANPTDAEAGRFSAFAAAGVNRLSLGVQALDDASLAFLGRNHGADEARRAATLGVRLFPRLSLDLIYALPGQTQVAWGEALREASGLGAEHLSPYQLTIEAGTPFDRAVRRGRFTPAEPDRAGDLYEATQEMLTALGFDAYEVSNHARGEAARSRHNLIYWRGEDYLGVGPSAHGRLTIGGERIATETPRAVGDYIARVRDRGDGLAVRDALDSRSRSEERLLMGLRTYEGVALSELSALSLDGLADLIAADLVILDADRLRATPSGRLVLDRVTQILSQ